MPVDLYKYYSDRSKAAMPTIQKITDKDTLIFCRKADHEIPSKYEVPAPLPNEKRHGVILPNGQINWSCPCLGGLPYGPCGFEFREFYTCLHNTQEDGPEGETSIADASEEKKKKRIEDCFPAFTAMKACFSQFPRLYPDDDDDDEKLSKIEAKAASKADTKT